MLGRLPILLLKQIIDYALKELFEEVKEWILEEKEYYGGVEKLEVGACH